MPTFHVDAYQALPTPPGEEAGLLASMVRELPHQVKDNVIILDVAPPKDVVDRIWVLAHDDILSGHSGMARTVARAESDIWWPGMAKELCSRTQDCPTS